MPTYLICFAQFHMDFRLPELESLAILEGVALSFDKTTYSNDHPFLLAEIESDEQAAKLVRRSILIKEAVRLWADEPSLPALLARVRSRPELYAPYDGSSFKFHVGAYGRTLDQDAQVARIEQFAFMPCGQVNLKTPDVEFVLIEDYGTVETRGAITPEVPFRVMFGVRAGKGDRSLITKYDLKKRKYLGTTSMDAELSLVMANQALAGPGSFVLDPFVGTGSFLVTCAHYGSYTLGADIDGRQIRGKDGRDIQSNAEQYNLTGRIVGTLIADIAHHPWRPRPIWDAIVCDPPYGVRAGAKKLGRPANSKVPEGPLPPLKRNGQLRYPQTLPYEMPALISDLLSFSATHLVPHGRLVYWLPTLTDEYDVTDVPRHPRMRLLANSAQVFGKWCRRLITMEKIGEEEEDVVIGEDAGQEPAHARFRQVYFEADGGHAAHGAAAAGRGSEVDALRKDLADVVI
ncbi:hypothetical protein HKX48_002997 [Thoreauomyces humboldtii]|nr:hypothetical protein HKX48_002997 [Thoreauomyces humboldtii]